MKKAVSNLLLVLICVVIGCAYAEAQPQRKRVAVMDFEFGALQRWWEFDWDVGRGVSDLMVDRLVADGTYSVIERKRLETVLAEQDFSNSARADARSASKIGKILGVDVIIVGSITQFGTEKKNFSVGGIGRKVWGGLGSGDIGTQKGKAKVAITARFIDVNTGEILASTTGVGESKRSGLLLGGSGGSYPGYGGGNVSMTSSDFRETIIGEATHAAVGNTVNGLTAFNSKIPINKVELRGVVADVLGRTVILNIGKAQGVQVGDTLKVIRATRTVKDPETGKVLREVTQEVGQIRIDEVDDGSATATITSGTGIKVGDIVRSHQP